MLTKEEYIDIIENLDFFYGDNLITTAELRKIKHRETQEKDLENFKKKINCLKQLINEHFEVIKEKELLEEALDKACELIKEAVSQDCTIFDEVIEDDYMWRTELEEWKEWCLKDVE